VRVFVTGSSAWPDPLAVGQELTKLYLQHGPYVLVHEGGGIGVDAAAHTWQEWAGKELGCFEVRHPADYEHHGRGARVRKGAELVATGADLVVAFSLFADEETRQIVGLAEEAGINVREILS